MLPNDQWKQVNTGTGRNCVRLRLSKQANHLPLIRSRYSLKQLYQEPGQDHIYKKKKESIPVGCVPPAGQPYVWWLPLGVSRGVSIHPHAHTQHTPPHQEGTWDQIYPPPGKDMRPGIPTHPREQND